MPLPKPRTDESRDEFIGRCMDDADMQSDFPDQSRRLAVCNTLYADDKLLAALNDLSEVMQNAG